MTIPMIRSKAAGQWAAMLYAIMTDAARPPRERIAAARVIFEYGWKRGGQ